MEYLYCGFILFHVSLFRVTGHACFFCDGHDLYVFDSCDKRRAGTFGLFEFCIGAGTVEDTRGER